VVGHPKNDFKFVVVAPFHSRETTTSGQPEFTIVREYAQGSNSECIVLPSGAFEKGKHETLRDVAAGELREEARVIGGTLIQMIDDDNPGLLETKWCLNRMFPFLSIDGERDDTVIERDAEEFNMTHERVTAKELKRHMYGGAMMMPSVVTAQMAIDHLLKSGHLTLDDF
jgi:ADP-ribose pyrophosphatase YjhB (NUDIX family)